MITNEVEEEHNNLQLHNNRLITIQQRKDNNIYYQSLVKM